MTQEESLEKHLDFIQNAISRMARNSFLLKGWSVTITAAIFALATRDPDGWFVAVALFPALLFWGLDAYYLRQERLFRSLYDEVRLRGSRDNPFTMDTSPYQNQVRNVFVLMFTRPTVLWFHTVVVATITFVAAVLNYT